mmetsp:Transcript_6721/g.12707  ORF Transcript_6721/g.12707 Transcript_6721/m.12707 type:complete len:210 (-) Transcript_6721:794-1423(-)
MPSRPPPLPPRLSSTVLPLGLRRRRRRARRRRRYRLGFGGEDEGLGLEPEEVDASVDGAQPSEGLGHLPRAVARVQVRAAAVSPEGRHEHAKALDGCSRGQQRTLFLLSRCRWWCLVTRGACEGVHYHFLQSLGSLHLGEVRGERLLKVCFQNLGLTLFRLCSGRPRRPLNGLHEPHQHALLRQRQRLVLEDDRPRHGHLPHLWITPPR